MSGLVYLVGAGPGDPKLITVKGIECIREANVVVYDFLASEQLLREARADAEIIYVGKTGKQHTLEQDQINELLVKKAKEGNIVTRLKGGDPFIFGRGGEEALELAKAGVNFEIVPGVSSAYSAPAYAGIPVTFRKYTSTVAFITGHEDPTKDKSDIDWAKISTGVGTLVFLMGVKNLPLIVEQLTKNGRDAKTPIALVRWGTTNQQKTLTGTLEDIVGRVKKAKFKAPAIIVVGKVVKLRDELSWFEKKPLLGKRIIITRSRSQASDLTVKLEKLGAIVYEIPSIKIEPPTNYHQLDLILETLNSNNPYDWIIFTSVNGVIGFLGHLKTFGADFRALQGSRIAAIGPATANALASLGITADALPSEYRAEAILPLLGDVASKNILVPRAEVAREVLPDELKKMGARVEVVPVYKTVIDESGREKAKKLLEDKAVDIVTFTSSSTVENFLSLIEDKSLLDGVSAIAIGPITADTAKENGLKITSTAKEYTIDGLVGAIIEAANR
ncbi:MAG: uroporphyrinogen-III C-methyltransferase [Actinobacteria bacterium]|nr:MAG: uroporphyrinogen-III C-methyltransferase [Actinomycetota bacterium]